MEALNSLTFSPFQGLLNYSHTGSANSAYLDLNMIAVIASNLVTQL